MSARPEGTPASTAPAPAETAGMPARQARLVVGGVMTGMMLSALDQTVVSTALPRIVSDLGGLSRLSWVVTGYLLTSMVVTPLWGKLSDMYGRRPVYMAAIGVFLAGSLLCAVAQDITQLVVFRAVQGLGGGGLFALAMTVIGDVVPPAERGRYQGWFGAVFGLASIGGPVLGGWLANGPGWRWIFWINLPVGLCSLLVVARLLRITTVRRPQRIDLAGAALITAGVTAVLLYLDRAADEHGWGSPAGLGLLAAGVAAGALFVLAERRAADPVIPLRLFANRVFRVAGIFGFLAGVAMFGGIVFLPVHLQVVSGFSATRAGLAMLPAMLGIVAGTTVAGRLISSRGRYKAYPVAGSLLLVAATALLARLRPDTPYIWTALLALVFGVGVGLTTQPVLTAVQNSVEPRDMGAAMGTANFFQRMGAAIGTAVLGAVFTARLEHHLGSGTAAARVDSQSVEAVRGLAEPLRSEVVTAFNRALDDVFLACVPCVVVAFAVSLLLKDTPPRDRAPSQ
ncbi:MDR family MFS transporter [Streptomyces sp. JHA26]|uniref:MDR family MFS transporter n=1 Tax=Streptomyces sp. JHA26 TaxID=1917143 RepID=UPI00209B6F24|nr:MDR family MFS transporter [Streptomyces sp. JHA26]